MLARMERPPIDPNVVTSLRLPLAPVAVALLVTGTVWGTVAAAVLALLLELSDLLDGYIARRYGLVTDFGKLYDPFSDAFTRYTLFLGLYAIDVASLWMVIAIFYRDAAISFFRTVAATRDVIVAARPSGKIKAVVQGVGMQLIMATLMGVVGTRDAHVYTRTHTCAHTRDEKETEAASDGEEKRTQL